MELTIELPLYESVWLRMVDEQDFVLLVGIDS
jgi:hypothetical protein